MGAKPRAKATTVEKTVEQPRTFWTAFGDQSPWDWRLTRLDSEHTVDLRGDSIPAEVVLAVADYLRSIGVTK